MKKWWVIPVLFVLLTIVVDAKCGDSFCDPDEDCTKCSVDCLCTRDKHDEQINCTTLFTSEECEKGYCHDKWCSTLEGFQSMFQKASCYENGSAGLTVKFQELDSVVLTPEEDLKVYMKLGDEATFEEIKGKWYNPSREGDFRYTKIRDTSEFNSDADLFKTKGDYYVRVKYRVGMSSVLFEDKLISCPGILQATPPAEEPKEDVIEEVPKEEIVEEQPAEEPVEETVEPVKEEPAEQAPKESKKSDIIWYVIIGLIILAAIFFFIKYEIKLAKRIGQQ